MLLVLPVVALAVLGMCSESSESVDACVRRGVRWHMDAGEWPTRPDGERTQLYVERECARSERAYPLE